MGALGARGGAVGATEPPGRGGVAGIRKASSQRGGGLRRSNFQKAFVFFHTETIKALKQAFGTKLKRVPSQPHRYRCFIGLRALCG